MEVRAVFEGWWKIRVIFFKGDGYLKVILVLVNDFIFLNMWVILIGISYLKRKEIGS